MVGVGCSDEERGVGVVSCLAEHGSIAFSPQCLLHVFLSSCTSIINEQIGLLQISISFGNDLKFKNKARNSNGMTRINHENIEEFVI